MNSKFNHSKLLIYGLLGISIFFNLFFLSRILRGSEPNGDDNSYHLANIIFEKELLAKDPSNYLDSFCDYWNMGFPINHYYHHLSYLIMGLVSFIFSGIPVYKLFNLSIVVLFSVFPLIIYKSLRYMEFNRYVAVFAALVSTFIECSLSHGGINLNAFLGSGLYTQLWAITILPMAMASVYHSMVHKERYCIFGLLLGITFLFNSVVGFVAIVNSIIFIFRKSDTFTLSFKESRERGKILLVVLILFFIFVSYWVIPLIANGAYNGGEPFAPKEGMQSYGYTKVIQELFAGRVFDYNHKIPFITPLLFIGIFFALFRKDERYRIAAISFLVWMIIFCGITPVVSIFKKLPFGEAIPFSRAVIALHFWAIVLCGIGLFELIRPGIFFGRFTKLASALKILLFIIIFIFIYKEMGVSVRERTKTFDDFNPYQNYRNQFIIFKEYLKELPDGRIYIKGQTGHGSHWLAGLTPAYGNRPIITGYSAAAGLQSLSFYYTEGFYPTVEAHYDLFNLKYIVSTVRLNWPDFAKKIYESYPFAIYAVPTSGYFDLVAADLLVVGNKENVRNVNRAWMQSGLLKDKEFMIISPDISQARLSKNYIVPDKYGQVHSLRLKANPQVQNINNYLQILNRFSFSREKSFGSLSNERRGINTYSVEADIKKGCFLLLKTTFHPNWHLFVNGAEKEKVMLSPAFMGVKLSPGEYSIVFKYRTGLLKWCLFIIAIAIGWIMFKAKITDALINSWLFEERYKYARMILLILLGISILAVYKFGHRKESPGGNAYLSNYTEEISLLNEYYLSDMPFLGAKQDDGVLGLDITFQGHIISLGGKIYAKGLGTQSNSEVVYNVAGFKEFKAVIGLDDELHGLCPNYASVIFKVYLDDRLVFASPVFYQNTPLQEISIPLNNAKILKLVVTDAGRGAPDGNLIWGDHADWADAKLIKDESP